MYKAHKTRLETNNKQETQLRRCAGVARYVYNWGLAEWKRQYEAGEKPSAFALRKQFNSIKLDECPFVTDVAYAITESAFQNLGAAFKNFFRRLKQGTDKAGYPKFKNRNNLKSFQLRGVKVFDDRVYLTNIGIIRLSERNYIPVGAVYGVYATISESGSKWYISVLVDDGLPEPELRVGDVLGIDVGIKSLAVFSDGTIFENPKALDDADKKLKRLQRELARRKIGGKNREKTKQKLARAFECIRRIRQHAQHQVSNYATAENGIIVIETLNINGMMQNHHIARALSDTGMSEIHRQIKYKAKWKGVEVIRADRWFASSKTCSGCGYKMDITLSDRDLKCPECGLEIDRDYNAALNLAALSEGVNSPGLPVELECNNALL